MGQSSTLDVASLMLNADGQTCPVCPVCPTGPGGPGAQVPPTPVGGDYDADNDGLIEIRSITQLDAIRYDLAGDGSENDVYVAAFPGAAAGMGCPSGGCKGYELANDLDFDTNQNGQADPGDAYWNSGDGWMPIGRYDVSYSSRGAFQAKLDGNHRTISNLYISRTGSDFVGLFGAVRGSNGGISQLGLVAVNVTGRKYVGGLVGYMDRSSSVTNSYVTGDVIGNQDVGGLVGDNYAVITDSHANSIVSGTFTAGGLVGAHHGGTIARSYADGEVNTSSHNAGGLAGYSQATINGSYATGDVFSVGNSAGGLVGQSRGIINGSYATGTVTGSGLNVGGLVGENRGGTINGSYSTASATGAFGYVGGLVGWHHEGGNINASYAIGSVTGNVDNSGSIGGLVGSNARSRSYRSDGGPVTLSYWNTQTTGQLTSAGSPNAAGKTTGELQSPTRNTGIYAGWSASWWDFGTSGQYPVLKYSGLSVALQRGQAAQPSTGAGQTTPTETDRAALVSFYNATGGDNWTSRDGWLSDAPIGEWHGVGTDHEGRVVILNLSHNGLTGTLPAEMSNLSSLIWLDLGLQPAERADTFGVGRAGQPDGVAAGEQRTGRPDTRRSGQPFQPRHPGTGQQPVDRPDTVAAGQPVRADKAQHVEQPTERRDPRGIGRFRPTHQTEPGEQSVVRRNTGPAGQYEQPGNAVAAVQPVDRTDTSRPGPSSQPAKNGPWA